MTTYEIPTKEVMDLLSEVMETYHQELFNEEVKVGVLMVHSVDKEGNPDGKHPLKKAGHAAAAMVKVVPLKDRITKGIDAEIMLDAYSWKESPLPVRRAIIDHELTHLQLVTNDKTGEVKTDDLDRPKLKTKPDDFFQWGFKEIAERHGINSIEVLNSRQLANQLGGVLGIAPTPISTPAPVANSTVK